jgi:hypothetical protein
MTTERRERWPDFFLVGHHKSGTTALYEMLRRHEQIFLPDLKEPRFMASDLPWQGPSELQRRNPRTSEEYLALFAGATAEQLVGDASATYLFSHTAATRIAEVQPEAKIIAILREPVSFLRSLHTSYVQIEFETELDLGRAIALEPARRSGEQIPPRAFLPQLLQYTEQVHYLEQLRRYEAHFDAANMLVLIYDDFQRDNDAVLRRVLSFLGVESTGSLPSLEANVTTWSYRRPRLGATLTSAALGRGTVWAPVGRAAKAVTTRRLRHGAMRALRKRFVLTDPPQLRPELASELRERFRPEVAAVGEHLGRDLIALWGYDSSG